MWHSFKRKEFELMGQRNRRYEALKKYAECGSAFSFGQQNRFFERFCALFKIARVIFKKKLDFWHFRNKISGTTQKSEGSMALG